MTMLNRRDFLAATMTGALAARLSAAAGKHPDLCPMGLVIHSYPIRGRIERDKGFADPLRFVEFSRERGAGGIQLPLGIRKPAYCRKLRSAAEKSGMYVEGSSRTPKTRADLDRFEAEVKTARECGATVIRTVLLGGRRYETFKTAAEFRAFKEGADRSLHLAEPVVARHKVHLAVENHKDFRAPELASRMKALSSAFVGVCVDTGNNVALLEEPLETVRTLAPWAVACHLKDMGVEEYPEGFLLAEVPLGEGFLDLKGIVELLRKARPEIRFSLEMITRDPLKVPCLSDGFWATLDDVPARDLARALALVRRKASKRPLPRISTRDQAGQLKAEEENVRRSLDYARKHLPLGV
jgi:3-oxoisoapionate decarboxylase